MSDPHVLIVDDARDIREPLAAYLKKHGFRVSLAPNAAAAREMLANGAIDLVILDVMMPGEDGLSLCRAIAADGKDGPPVILLTAMADDADRIVGLELGADDYVVKPFNPRELLARMRAVLRRVPPPPPKVKTGCRAFSGWRHDPSSRTLLKLAEAGAEPVPLTSAENKLLTVFLERPQEVLSRDQLLDLTAGREAKPYDRAIDNHISRLRRKIEPDPKNPSLIVTEWGGGYRLAADVVEDEAAQESPG
ncbi:MAG: response regulator transcription factor [Pseudomonadota bacterium]